ncbi:uncharacterized protein LOC106454468 isoform X2 [Brassica napus]|uniref:uncharacterized protein LOC106454468 isoform X2 n=1 Tax=Brassica napus TaxID=3708 RepID=UPI00087225AC|nr:uncharacterized protein LOC106454468 isoform X2 [Brassica napus]
MNLCLLGEFCDVPYRVGSVANQSAIKFEEVTGFESRRLFLSTQSAYSFAWKHKRNRASSCNCSPDTRDQCNYSEEVVGKHHLSKTTSFQGGNHQASWFQRLRRVAFLHIPSLEEARFAKKESKLPNGDQLSVQNLQAGLQHPKIPEQHYYCQHLLSKGRYCRGS